MMETQGKLTDQGLDSPQDATLARYAIGIDLGTTNCEIAYIKLDDQSTTTATLLDVPQFVDDAVVESLPSLPSFLYLGDPQERQANDWRLPWDKEEKVATSTSSSQEHKQSKAKHGVFKKLFGLASSKTDSDSLGLSDPEALCLLGTIAKKRHAQAPNRVIASAKSWLTCIDVDKRAAFLPKAAATNEPKASPKEVAKQLLKRLSDAWKFAFPNDPFTQQLVVVTIPASFDASAREITREAALDAGFNEQNLIFLEEPLAALYSWLAKNATSWRKKLHLDDIILVCDVGGGTTDLTLVKVEEQDGSLALNRIAIGRRLLLGGDNIDLALAHHASGLLRSQGVELNPWQSTALLAECRDAKETLLDPSQTRDTYKITLQGRSSRLVGESLSVDFAKEDAVRIAVDGFFPICSADSKPQRRSRVGLREKGLPYETDPAITKHIASFLADAGVMPNWVLFNGGVFKAQAITERLQEQLGVWTDQDPPKRLDQTPELDFAVATGAAYFALAKVLGGVKIRAASARSYYIGIESSAPAIPGVSRPIKALCVAPFGMEEGEPCTIDSEPFELILGEQAEFRLFCSTTRPHDAPGDVLDYYDDVPEANCDLQETAPLVTTLTSEPADDAIIAQAPVEPEFAVVQFSSIITESGALEIWCEETSGARRWKLEFSAREE
ncbi:MAG: Hsp70 family protein [Planctomycetia bacterium]|nr:Hsp70 family protein [Planctomycetia bacterium]